MLWRSPTTDALRGSAFTLMAPMLNNSTPATSRLGIRIVFSSSHSPHGQINVNAEAEFRRLRRQRACTAS
jgi:hypothetical protein